jgi:hypothetical protein
MKVFELRKIVNRNLAEGKEWPKGMRAYERATVAQLRTILLSSKRAWNHYANEEMESTEAERPLTPLTPCSSPSACSIVSFQPTFGEDNSDPPPQRDVGAEEEANGGDNGDENEEAEKLVLERAKNIDGAPPQDEDEDEDEDEGEPSTDPNSKTKTCAQGDIQGNTEDVRSGEGAPFQEQVEGQGPLQRTDGESESEAHTQEDGGWKDDEGRPKVEESEELMDGGGESEVSGEDDDDQKKEEARLKQQAFAEFLEQEGWAEDLKSIQDQKNYPGRAPARQVESWQAALKIYEAALAKRDWQVSAVSLPCVAWLTWCSSARWTKTVAPVSGHLRPPRLLGRVAIECT